MVAKRRAYKNDRKFLRWWSYVSLAGWARGQSRRRASIFIMYLCSFNVNHGIFKTVEIGFTARQVVRLTGVPYSTLNLWAKNGLVQPSVAPGTGSGSERVYSLSDLVALKVAFELRKSGVTTSSLKKIVEFLHEREQMEKPLSEARLVVKGSDVAIVHKGELTSVLLNPGQGYLSFVVDLSQMLGEIVNIADSAKAFAHGIVPVSASSEHPRKRSKSADAHQRTRARKEIG